MRNAFADAVRIGFEEMLDVLTGEDTFPEAIKDVYERLQELENEEDED